MVEAKTKVTLNLLNSNSLKINFKRLKLFANKS